MTSKLRTGNETGLNHQEKMMHWLRKQVIMPNGEFKDLRK